MAITTTMTFFGDDMDSNGMPKSWFHYLIIASPGPAKGWGVASIVSLSEARATGVAQGPSKTVWAKEGGDQAALKLAMESLRKEHPGLKEAIG